MDLTLRLLREGYDAVAHDRRSRRGGPDHRSRLLGRRALVVQSRPGVRLFYDESVAARAGVIPPPLGWLLFGRGAVHTLDGDPHRRRKLLLLDALSADRLGPAVDEVERLLREAVPTWDDRVVDVHDELVGVYGRAVLAWAGIGLPPAQALEVSRCLAAIVDGFGFAGTAYVEAWRARVRANRWARGLVQRVRDGEVGVTEDSPLALVAGSDLDTATAGVELLNLLRPTVAVAWLGAFAALALAGSDERAACWRERLLRGTETDRLAFAQEVRRTAPFVPVLAARTTREVELASPDGTQRVPRGTMLVLDVVGIHRDPQRWPDPEVFDPERFAHPGPADPGAFDLVPQGGGHPSGHRCPGESLTVRLLETTARVLAELDVRVVDGRVDRSRMPTVPTGGTRVVTRPPQTAA